jgi:hypothetical protein
LLTIVSSQSFSQIFVVNFFMLLSFWREKIVFMSQINFNNFILTALKVFLGGTVNSCKKPLVHG